MTHHEPNTPWWAGLHSHANRLTAHAPLGAWEDEAQSRAGDRTASRFVLPLDGTWRFALAPNPAAVPDGWADEGFDRAGWADITVPGHWELQGHGKPIYVNVPYPFAAEGPTALHPHAGGEAVYNPPHLPEDNPTGCYWRTFHLPEDWQGRQVLVELGGAESACALWVNGQPVGWSQDSKLPCAFDVTPQLRPGVNTIGVLVPRFCAQGWLEDQDYWHLSGLFRPVRLIAKPRQAIVDWNAQGLTDRHGPGGVLHAHVWLRQVDGYADCAVRLRLWAPDGTLAAEETARPDATRAMYGGPGNSAWPGDAAVARLRRQEPGAAHFEVALPHVAPWDTDEPNLYRATFTLLGPDGAELDHEGCAAGFRRVEIADGVVKLNGRRLIVRGVDRHEFAGEWGRAVPADHMRREILLMKRLNFNAVRTSHYPDDPAWYDLCDELGILLVCEANLETHGVEGRLTADPAWADAFLDRAVRMVLTHRNHPSILFWSLGNESGVGANHAAMAGWIRWADPTRLVQYEGGLADGAITDIVCPMYFRNGQIEEYLADPNDHRPLIQVEYAYQMSNSGGNFDEYWQDVERFARFQGGFVWDWQDKALPIRDGEGRFVGWGYGGDFDEGRTDRVPFMCANGVVGPDLTPKPAADEIANCQAPVVIVAERNWLGPMAGRYVVRNRCQSWALDRFTLAWTALENGLPVAEGTIDLPPTPPMEDWAFALEPELARKPGREYHLNFSFRLAQATPWATAGHEVHRTQFALPGGASVPPVAPAPTVPAATVAEWTDSYTLSAGSLVVSADRATGRLIIARDGQVLLTGGEPCFFRPPTGIDRGQQAGVLQDWLASGYDRLESTLVALRAHPGADGSAWLEVVRWLQAPGVEHGITHRLTVEVSGAGLHFDWQANISTSLSHLPRVGVEWTVDGAFEGLRWFGRGPGENYRDRKSAALVGQYACTVEDTHHAFLPPCECGGHEDTRWLTLTAPDGRVLRVTAQSPLHFDAHHNTSGDYAAATHDHELTRRAAITLHLDGAHAGLGGDDGWSKSLRPAHRLEPGVYSGSFTLTC